MDHKASEMTGLRDKKAGGTADIGLYFRHDAGTAARHQRVITDIKLLADHRYIVEP